MHNFRPVLLLTALSLPPAARAQALSASPKPLTFDAASIKPWGGPGSEVSDGSGKTIARKQPGMGGNINHPGRIHYQESLTRLLMRAYDLGYYQIQGPDWLNTQFVVDGVMPPETTQDQSRLMLQNLLVERFKLAIHRETKETPGHSLEIARSGPKLQETTVEPLQTVPPEALPPPPRTIDELVAQLGPDGFPNVTTRFPPNGIAVYRSEIGWKVFFHAKTMRDLADYLWERMGSPVTDSTGLESRYDFSLTYLPDDAPSPSGPLADRFRPAPNISQALESQLALKLEKRKVTVQMLVIDHVERTPTEN